MVRITVLSQIKNLAITTMKVLKKRVTFISLRSSKGEIEKV